MSLLTYGTTREILKFGLRLSHLSNIDLVMSTFLNLPGELRNNVYDQILIGIFSQSRSHPWAPLQSRQPFLSLLLCCQQIYYEIKSLFDKKYAPSLTIYFDNLAALVYHHWESKRQSAIQNAYFQVRDVCHDVDKRGAEDWMVILLKSQPGFKYWWLERTTLYRAKPIHRRIFEEREFCYSENWKARGCLKDVGTCAGYRKLEYPRLKNGCKITSYSWTTQTHGRHSFESGSMVLEGKLRDLVIDDSLIPCLPEKYPWSNTSHCTERP